MKKVYLLIVVGIFLISNTNVDGFFTKNIMNNVHNSNPIGTRSDEGNIDDFDPLVDVSVTVEIKMIRFLAINELQTFPKNEGNSSPNFYVKVYINNVEFTSPVWNDTKYITDSDWNATLNVPDDVENVTITIQLWSHETEDILYDISGDLESYDVTLLYSIKTGYWTGDDSRGDVSGYGRLCGCDDGTIYENDRDCELWFDITQNDYDGDHIPYWIEVNTLGTDPTVDDSALDPDNDSIPTYWEYKWGYQLLTWNDFENIDPDNDSINNIEEFLTSQWFSDPFRKDVFVEMDIMTEGPLRQNSSISSHSKELLRTAFNRRNIVFHLDDGCMGGGGEIIPFDRKTNINEFRTIYSTYFLNNDIENWRRGVFRYAMIIYHYATSGFACVGEYPRFYWHVRGINTFVISTKTMHETSLKLFKQIDHVFAGVIMHELGHTFGIDFMFPVGCDNTRTYRPLNLGFWLFAHYKSCMNYRYVYTILDYSDGSHGLFDYDDWSNLDFTFFEKKTL